MIQSQFNGVTGVGHYRVDRAGTLTDFLGRLNLAPEVSIHECLRFGAVYVDGVRARPDGSDAILAPDQIIRLHTRPKRYVVPPLNSRVIFVDDGFLALDKPSGVPTHATLDNALENAVHTLGVERGERLFVTHRLDVPTNGVLLLARTAYAQAMINKQFARAAVEKTYRAVSRAPVPPGEYRHFINPAAHVPRPIETSVRAGWWDCRLIVEDVGPDIAHPGFFTHRVRPLTGKTHQIRAQFAALGAPLTGDVLYGGPPAAEFGLTCERMRFTTHPAPGPARYFDIARGR